MVNFPPGTSVRVINIKPKYLTGITGDREPRELRAGAAT